MAQNSWLKTVHTMPIPMCNFQAVITHKNFGSGCESLVNFQCRHSNFLFSLTLPVKESDTTVVCSLGFRSVRENATEKRILFLVLSHSGVESHSSFRGM